MVGTPAMPSFARWLVALLLFGGGAFLWYLAETRHNELLFVLGAFALCFGFVAAAFGGMISGVVASVRATRFEGVRTTGRVVSSRSTGVFVNNHPMLSITVAFETREGARHESIARCVVPLHQLARVEPGREVVLKYNPADTAQIALLEVVQPEARTHAH
jgi:hypothetical protein